MRNLSLLSQMRLARFGRPAAKDIHHCVDPETGIVYVAYSTAPGEGVLVEISDLQSPFPAVDELVTFPPENDVHADRWGQVVGIKFLVDIQAICIVFSHGDVALFHKEPTETGETLEIVGSVDSGILCMAWSPDDELVVMVTGEGSILEMTKDFDVIAENKINVEESGEDISVNVGWGKKETQFHGSEGKAAAQRKVDASTFSYSPDDDQRPRLSWRGDGTYFCCSTMDSQHGRRVIRMYNREAVLQNTSEPVDMLEHSLSWRPSGNLIASSQRLPHRHDIVFFERNGLRHGEFSIREDKETVVKEVLWNCDSTVLAVWLERTNGSCVQLWMMNNYHWYLKQEILFNEEGGHVASVQWDVEAALTIHIVTENGSYQRHEYCWDHCVNEMHTPDNAGSVAVIDGANLLLTPFKMMNVPPPMSAFSLKLPYAIQHVSFSTINGGDDMAVLLADQRLAFYSMDRSVRPLQEPKLLGIVETALIPSTLIRQIAWVREDTLIGLQYDSDLANDALVVLHLSFDTESRTPKIVSRSDLPLEGQFQRLYFNQTYGDILLHQANGSLMRVVLDQEASTEPRVEPLHEIQHMTEGCLWIGTTRIGTSPDPQYRDLAVVGLTRNNRLYVNERLVSSEATSFSLHNYFLVFTTATHTARFLPLETSLSEFKVVDNSSLPYDESVRRVERGSRIVLAVQHSVNLVLQMPRGNLETIAPRALVLSATRDALDKNDFRTALVTCRKHRIDLNLLYDHNPQRFMENVGEFVRQVKDVDYLNLFLSFLRNEDVTKTLYPVTGISTVSPPAQQPTPASAGGAKGAAAAAAAIAAAGASADPQKVNTICEAVRKELETMDRKTYINTILTTHVRMTPPDLESALTLLAELRDQDAALAEDALKFTIFLADVNRLFDVALGMYDFGLVLMVAQYSQKDPREYLPFLNELRALEKYYQRFRIDDHLKRHARALTNLSQAGEKYFDECLAYTKKHSLYKEAIKIYRPTTAAKYKAVLKIYGDHLSGKGDMEQAGLAYSMAGDKEEALEAYKTGQFWREAVVLAQQLGYDKAAMSYLASTMADNLRSDRRFAEAAVLLADYALDTEEAMAALLEGRLWSEASRLAYVSQRLDLVETHVLPGIGDGHQEIMDTIREMKEQLEKQIKRLAEVRELRIQKMLAEQRAAAEAEMMGHDEMLDNVDMMSDTTSMASGFSRYTKANTVMTRNTNSSRQSAYTARLRRRQERKRQTGKKGSIFEEEYLIGSLRKLIVRIDAFKTEVAAMLKALAGCMLLQRADALQAEFSNLLSQVDRQIPIIFVPAPQEHLDRKKAQQEAIAERRKLNKQLSANAHLLSRQEEAVLQAQIAQLDEIVDDEIAEIYGEPPVLSKDAWEVDVI